MKAYYWVETKGKTLEEIDAIFEGEKNSSVPDVEVILKGEQHIDSGAIEQELAAELETIAGPVKAG